MLVIGFIGNVIAGAAALLILFIRFPVTMGVIPFVGGLWLSGNLVLPQ